MNATPTPQGDSPVEALFRQRDQLQAWIGRLGEVQTQVPDHVAERVRRDYQERLRAVTAELSTHREAIQADLASLRAELHRAEELRTAAADDLEEVRLRHLIGELDAAAWAARRPDLEGAVATATAAADRSRAEVDRLAHLLDGLEGGAEAGGGAPPAGAPAAAGAAPAAAAAATPDPVEEEPEPWEVAGTAARDTSEDTVPEFETFAAVDEPAAAPANDELGGIDLSWLDEVEEASTDPGAPRAAPAEGEAMADDLAFLEELDRAIAASPDPAPGAGGAAGAPSGADDPDRTLDADRAGMLLCKECGAINEPQLWYCEICGSEL